MVFFLCGCASQTGWKNIYELKEKEITFNIYQNYKEKNKTDSTDINIQMMFTQESFVYPYKFEKFYHILHFINTKELDIEIYSDYKITHMSDNYSFVVKLKNKESIKNIVEKITNKKINKEIIDEEKYYIFDLIVNKSDKSVNIKIKSSKDKNILDNKKIVK